jgi:hypothetical protein
MIVLNRRTLLLISVAVGAGLALGFAATLAALPVRPVLTIAYLVLGPGAAILWLARMNDRVLALALVVPLSLAVDAAVATAVIYAGFWSPRLIFIVVVGVTIAAIHLGARERSAVAALITLAVLPSMVLLTGQMQ